MMNRALPPLIFAAFAAACSEPAKPPVPQPKPVTPAPAPAAAPAAPAAPGESMAAPPGDFRLVRVQTSPSVYVLHDGKVSAISNWGWVERNAPGKTIETVSQQQLDSYPPSGIVYK